MLKDLVIYPLAAMATFLVLANFTPDAAFHVALAVEQWEAGQ